MWNFLQQGVFIGWHRTKPKEYSAPMRYVRKREKKSSQELALCAMLKICPSGAEHPDDYWGDAGK